MNLLDLALGLLLMLAVVGGIRVGFVARAMGWLGIVAGLLAASWTVPLTLGLLETEPANLRLLAGLGTLAVTVALCAGVFGSVGRRLRAGIGGSPLSAIDRLAGGLAGGLMLVALAWLLLPVVAQAPGALAGQARSSATLATLERVAPPPTVAMDGLQSLLRSSGFPEVWEDLRPVTDAGPPPEDIPVDAEVVARATRATVRVEAYGCGRRYDGSGVVVGRDLIVTNAHVVAGADEVWVRSPERARRSAAVVTFDPDRDLALLSTEGLEQPPLPLAAIPVGELGVSIGYPGGQAQPRVAPLRVQALRQATGRDIYGEGATQREVLFLSAELRPGDSGSPVIDGQGRVGGIVFAISPDDASSAYAVALSEVEALLAAQRTTHDAGRCIG